MQYEVVVGNIGTVYTGESLIRALNEYRYYVQASKRGEGRCAGESVTLIGDGEIHQAYDPDEKEEDPV